MQSEEEKHRQLKQLEKELTQICPSVYFDKRHSAYCPKYGWMDIVKQMSLKFEMLNLQLKRYRVQVEIQQCKDKFGELRVYADVFATMPACIRCIACICDSASAWIQKHVDFKMKTVVDTPSYVKMLEEEIDEAEYDRCIKYPASNVRYVKRDDKFFRQGAYQSFRVTHQEVTQHKLMHMLMSLFAFVSQKLSHWHQCRKYTAKQQFGLHYGDMMCSKIIKEAEEESAKTCESCGCELSQSGFSKHCVTCGWIRNLCMSCAQSSGVEFFVDGELHKGQKCILSKEETQKKFGEHAR